MKQVFYEQLMLQLVLNMGFLLLKDMIIQL